MGAHRAPLRRIWPLALLGLLLTAPLRAAEPADPCAAEALQARLVAAGLPVSALELTAPGATLVLTQGGEPAGGLWFGFLADGELATTRRELGLRAAGNAELTTLFREVVAALDQARDLRSCATLALPAFDAVAGQAHLEAVLKPLGRALASTRSLERSSLALTVHGLVALAWLAYLGVLGVLAGRAARRRPVDALWALGLAGLALGVRLWLSARGPVEAANADFTHAVDVATWLREGLDVTMGASYPPSFRILLLGVFGALGPWLEAGFVVTTVLGSLVAVPAYALARRLTGSRAAGVVAGLALAAYPPAVFFSNGLVLVTPAALLLTLAFAHAAALIDDGDAWDAAGALLALGLFVQCRTEAAGIAALAVTAFAAALLERRRLGSALRRWGPAILLAAAAMTPYVVLTAGATTTLAVRDVAAGLLATALLRMVAVVLGALAVAALLARYPRLALPALGLTVVGALAWAGETVVAFSGNAFAPTPMVVPEIPFADFHSDVGPWAFGTFTRTASWQEPAFLPVPFGALRWLALVPAIGLVGARVPVLVVALVALPIVGGELTSFIATGIAGLEGLRFHVPYTGLLAVSVGVGAERVLAWSGFRGRARAALLVGLVGLALAPLVTHRAFVTDTDRDQRAEYLFARDALARLPEGAMVLLPDAPFELRDDVGTTTSTTDVFRTTQLLEAVAWSLGRRFELRGLREVSPGEVSPTAGAWLFRGLDCHRGPRPLPEEPDCAAARAVTTHAPVALRVVPTRIHANHSLERIGPATRELRFELVRLEPAELKALQARLEPLEARRRSSGLTGPTSLP